MSTDWLDLRERLNALLLLAEQEGSGLHGLHAAPVRLAAPVALSWAELQAVQDQALQGLAQDADEALFTLFQALTDVRLGYCASHALLSALVCELTAARLGFGAQPRAWLFSAALLMNAGMCQAQDQMALQPSRLTESQRRHIKEHPLRAAALLTRMSNSDSAFMLAPELLDLVRWHHEPHALAALPHNLLCRQILRHADSCVAKMAPRQTRLAMSALGGLQTIFLADAPEQAHLAASMAAALGFYPPGTYVQLVNGERAVVLARGPRPSQAYLLSICNAAGRALPHYIYHSAEASAHSIRAPLNPEQITHPLRLDEVARLRLLHLS